MKSNRLNARLSGTAGEYFVAAELSRRGLIAALLPYDSRGVDLLVASPDGSRSIAIQVKTNQDSRKEWLLGEKAERIADSTIFYVFVNLNGRNSPSYHIVPSEIVATVCATYHQGFLERSRSDGRRNKDNPRRKFLDRENKYRDAWDILGLLPATSAASVCSNVEHDPEVTS